MKNVDQKFVTFSSMKFSRFTGLSTITLLIFNVLTLTTQAEVCPDNANLRSNLNQPIESKAWIVTAKRTFDCKVDEFNGNDTSFYLTCANGAKVYQTDNYCLDEDTDSSCSHYVNVITSNGAHFKLLDVTSDPNYGITIRCIGNKFQVNKKIEAHQKALSFTIHISVTYPYQPPKAPLGF